MELKSVRVLRGPSVWSDSTVLVGLAHIDSTAMPDIERVASRLAELLGSAWVTGSSCDRTLPAGLRAAWLWAELALSLQNAIGARVALAEAQPTGDAADFRLIVEYCEASVGRAALELAERLLVAIRDGGQFDLTAELGRLREIDLGDRLGPSTGAIVRAAVARGIPARRLNDGSFVQFGYGACQRRIWASETDRTGAIAEAIAQDKELTKSLLANAGVPVPEGQSAGDPDQAWQAAQEIGLPVVVKPSDGNQGRGVSVGLDTREAVLAAFETAAKEGRAVLVERHVVGSDFRLLVVGGRVVAAARREVPVVVGDGRHSIRELVDIGNQDPRRGDDHATALSKLLLDDIALEVLGANGLSPSSVPAAGKSVVLRRNANLSTGGSAVDVTDELDDEVAARAVEAAHVVGLDVAGIDVVAPRIDRPLEETGGAIVEVNAAPGLRMHLEPSEGTPRDVGRAVIDTLFDPGATGRIPIVSVTGTNGKTTTVRCISHLLRALGRKVGMTCTDGIYIDTLRIDPDDCSGPRSARAVLSHPEVEAAVLETARGGILREGLGFDWCDVAVVTNIADGDHLGLGGVETAEQLASVKQTVVRRVSREGAAVLNGQDPLVVTMGRQCPGTIIYFARNAEHPVVTQHRAQGGRAVFARDGSIYAAIGPKEWSIASLERVPLTQGGRIGFQVENAMAAIATVWFLGMPIDLIRSQLERFTSDVQTVPGRFNVLSRGGSTVILDYGHNASALSALVDAIENMPHRSRSIVYTAAGDRRDRDIIQQAMIIGNGFDRVFLYEDKCTRGRDDGEVIRLMQDGLRGTRRVRQIHETRGEFVAIKSALESLGPGDLLLCQVDQVEEALEFVQDWMGRVDRPVRREYRPSGLRAPADAALIP
jgi:cyanophycin synthetase